MTTKKMPFILLLTIVVTQFVAGQQLHLPYTCTTTVCQPGISVSSGNTHGRYQQGPPGKRGGVGQKGDKGDPCHCDVADEQVIQSLRNEWKKKVDQYDDIIERLNRLEDFPENCSIRLKTSSGVNNFDRFNVVPIYPLKFIGDVTPWMVNCTKILSDGTDGWITIHRRQDGGTDFYRNWESYAKGFGNRQEEFWLGLTNIHKITTTKTCKLRVDLKDFSGRKGWAEYNTFKVANEELLFRLTISGFAGNIPDMLAYHNGRAFSAIDRDNDDHSSAHCARSQKGSWWYGSCDTANLNTVIHKTAPSSGEGVNWDGFAPSMPFAEMKVFCI